MYDLLVEHVGKVYQELPRLKLSNIGYVGWMKALMIDTIFYVSAIEVVNIFSVSDSFDG